MIPNINEKTGIHFGVIPVQEFNSEMFYDSLECHYNCHNCEFNPQNGEEPQECMNCGNFSNVYDTENLKIVLNEDNTVWIFFSEYTTRCAVCSPCAPNAGYITDQQENGLETYCPPPEWLQTSEKFIIRKICNKFQEDKHAGLLTK